MVDEGGGSGASGHGVMDVADELGELVSDSEVSFEFSIPFHGKGSWMVPRPGATGGGPFGDRAGRLMC